MPIFRCSLFLCALVAASALGCAEASTDEDTEEAEGANTAAPKAESTNLRAALRASLHRRTLKTSVQIDFEREKRGFEWRAGVGFVLPKPVVFATKPFANVVCTLTRNVAADPIPADQKYRVTITEVGSALIGATDLQGGMRITIPFKLTLANAASDAPTDFTVEGCTLYAEQSYETKMTVE